MDKQQAIHIIEETFKHSFDKSRFTNFIRNLLNHIDESKATVWSNQRVKDAFKEHVQHYERLGTYETPEKEKVDILIVHLTRESKLEHARTAIRNFVADHLKTRDEKDAALVAFVSPTEQQWRFSYVKMEYASIEKESGKIGVETRLTPARRFSYLVGEGESCHTAQTRFIGLLQNTETDPKFSDIEEAFSVEAVTKEFFTKYVELFEKINKALEGLLTKDKTLREEFKEKNLTTVDFAKKLMGQIVFLYFIQKKGWLGVAKGKDWGTGPHDFLRKLANGEHGKYTNFFNDILEPLFYDTLATDRGHEAWCNRFKCRIPFLNGGLFEPLCDYDWRKADIVLSNKLFLNSEYVEEGITGTGVLDVFDRYNFTVNESEPLEKEVAIDPEMLGKVFENLIEENRRKSLGAHYTPREIVHYMCQESLINYLDNTLNKETILVPREDIETFIHLGEQISHYESVEAKYAIRMPKSIEKHARLIDEKLKEITVCDPAVGSGAFPVGMMMEIVRARLALTPYFNDVHERTAYHFKRHAIQNCLYGVDIDPSAVEIAKLRLWLSLVVDEEETNQIKPLPNLDYKIMQGNSLIEEYEGIKLFDEGLIKAAPIELMEQIKNIRNKINSLQKLYIELHSVGKLTKVKKVEIDEQMKQQQSILKQLQKGKDSDSVDADLFDALSAAKKNWEELKKKHQEFFSSSDKAQKDELRKRIANLELELIKATLEEQGKTSSIAKIEEHIRANTRPFFLWKLNFGEIFLSESRQESGFDIVIGNPPYVGQKGHKELFEELKNSPLGKKYHQRRMDLFYFFFHCGLLQLKYAGILSFISTNYYLTATYSDKLRKHFYDDATIMSLINFNELKVFESATGQHNLITSLRKGKDKTIKALTAITKRTGVANNTVLVNILNHTDSETDYSYQSQDSLFEEGTLYIRIEPNHSTSDNASKNIYSVLKKIRKGNETLSEYCLIEQGIVSGADKVSDQIISDYPGLNLNKGDGIFILTKKEIDSLNLTKEEKSLIKPIYKNSDLKKWHFKPHKELYLIYLKDEGKPIKLGKNLSGHFEKYKKILVDKKMNCFKNPWLKKIVEPWLRRGNYFVLFYPRNKESFEKIKIVNSRRSYNNAFALEDQGYFEQSDIVFTTLKPAYENKIDLRYLLAILNSKLLYIWLYYKGKRKGEQLEIFQKPLSEVPIKYVESKLQTVIVNKVQKVIDAKKKKPDADITTLECEIDQLVYELYGLTKEEIAIVEGNLKE